MFRAGPAHPMHGQNGPAFQGRRSLREALNLRVFNHYFISQEIKISIEVVYSHGSRYLIFNTRAGNSTTLWTLMAMFGLESQIHFVI